MGRIDFDGCIMQFSDGSEFFVRGPNNLIRYNSIDYYGSKDIEVRDFDTKKTRVETCYPTGLQVSFYDDGKWLTEYEDSQHRLYYR